MQLSRRLLSIVQDLFGVSALTVICLGLGIYARGGSRCAPTKQLFKSDALAYPVFDLVDFRKYVATPGGVVLDARSAAEYAEGHVPTAISLPQPEFDRAYDAIKDRLEPYKERLIVVYCSDVWCDLADEVQQRLADRGFRHVARYSDGWHGWSDAGLPVEKQQP